MKGKTVLIGEQRETLDLWKLVLVVLTGIAWEGTGWVNGRVLDTSSLQ